MRLESRAIFVTIIATLTMIGHVAPASAESAAIPVILKNGNHGVFENGRLMLRRSGGSYAAAPRGSYVTLERTVLVVRSQGRLDPKTIAELRVTVPASQQSAKAGSGSAARGAALKSVSPQPRRLPTPSTSWGQRRQTGTNM